jgi:DNA topoisomerase VI subunit A
MSEQAYVERNFSKANVALIGTMNAIVTEYVNAGYRLTVRQLYYQLVARAVVPNTEKSYKRITSVVNDAKLAGLMDWDAIEDRTRAFIRRQRWESAAQIVRASADSFHMDMWEGQKQRVVVVVEKEALAGVLERACNTYDVPLLAARGYPSGTVLREFAKSDVLPAILAKPGQRVIILHLGDHDPSGIDMTRDLQQRIQLFADMEFDVEELDRIALTMVQIKEQKPPPNPAKETDRRFAKYRRQYGVESWELDALKPDYLDRLVTAHIKKRINAKVWKARAAEVETLRAKISKVADKFEKDNA